MWKKLNWVLLGLIVLLVLVVWQMPKKRLEIVFCDVGQGDAVLVSYGNLQMLVDGGPDNAVLSCLGKNMAFWDRKIELVVVSHPQADHMTGIIDVVRRYKVGQLAMTRVENDTPEVRELKKVINLLQVPYLELRQGEKLQLGGVEIEVLWPLESWREVSDINQVSTVLLGSYGGFEFLLTGDIDIGIEDQLRLTDKLREVEVLKVAHHGSKYSSGEQFLRAVKPKLAVIEVGQNRFGHPTEEVLERLSGVGSRIMKTNEDGQVKVISDGENWWVQFTGVEPL